MTPQDGAKEDWSKENRAKENGAKEDGANTPAAGDVRSLASLWPFVRPYLKLLVAAMVVLLGTAAIALTVPYALRLVVDGFNAPDATLHNRYFLQAIGAVALLAIGSSLRNYLTKLLGERVALDLRKAVFAKMIHMSPAYFERMMTGDILSRITADTTLILLVISNASALAMRHAVMLGGGLLMLFVTSPKLMGLVVLIVPLVMGPILAIGRRVRANASDNQRWIAASSAQASEALLAAQTVQAFSAEGMSTTSFNAITGQAIASARKMVRSHALMNAIVILCVFLGMVAIVWQGAQEVQAGAISVGELVQFAFYSVIVSTSVAAFSDVWGDAQRGAGAADRLVALLEAEDTVKDPARPVGFAARAQGQIAFEDVRFRYPARPSVAAMDGVSFSVAPGETVALVGPSGAGKSTVLQLLLRFYDPEAGQITIDGVDLRTIRRDALRGHIAIVQQDPTIFAGTARDNIRFGRPDASDAEVEAAAQAAAAHGFIQNLPLAYDTFLGERGVMLSGGQKQRIAIARAILRDAPILLLDEATSALDSESEKAIQDAVEALSVGRTTLIIAHRLATVESADRILVFEAGRIVASGTHAELLAQDGLYARYARAQLIADTPKAAPQKPDPDAQR